MRGFHAFDFNGRPARPTPSRDRAVCRELNPDAGADLDSIASYDVCAIALDTAATWSAPAS
jgi:hypothetical protein